MTSDQEQDGGLASQAMLTVAAVARRLGVAPSTLRTWDRRYGLGPSAHTAGSHRRYSPADLSRLSVMRGLIVEGVPPAEAAQIARTTVVPGEASPASGWPAGTSALRPVAVPVAPAPPAASAPTPTEERHPVHLVTAAHSPAPSGMPAPAGMATSRGVPMPEGSGRAVWPASPLAAHHLLRAVGEGEFPVGRSRDVAPNPSADDALDSDLAAQLDEVLAQVIDSALGRSPAPLPSWGGAGARAGGGRVISLPDASPRARGLARAAMSLDTHELTRLLRDAIGAFGVIGAWNSMVLPVLQGLGERWRATGDGVDVEHAFAEATLGVLRGVSATLYRPRNVRPVLLACADGDYHSLPLHVLSAALAEVEVGCRLLGVGLPASALFAAVRRTGPAVVFVYARMPVGDGALLREFPRQRPAPRVLVGGPGWQFTQVPPTVVQIDSLQGAVDEVRAAVQL